MKVIIYTLTADGHVPDYVFDGGYFPKTNEKNSPQDYDLIGLAHDSAIETELADRASILSYTSTYVQGYTNPISQEYYSPEVIVTDWCDAKGIE